MKKSNEKLNQINIELHEEKQKAVAQLKSLFAIYNQQKNTIDELNRLKDKHEKEKKELIEKLDLLEKEKSEISKELSQKNETLSKQSVYILCNNLPE